MRRTSHRANLYLPIRETDRQVQRFTAHMSGNLCWVGKPELELTSCWRLSVDYSELENPWGSSYAGTQRFWDFYLLGFYQVLTVNVGEKCTCASVREREEESF